MHHPDLLDDDAQKNGLVCFIDGARPCGADCMAYLVETPEGPDYTGQWARCMLLVNFHRGAKHLTILAQVADGLLKRNRSQAADQIRASQSPPPVPR